jgi:Uma2 family endonuclease
MIQAPPRTILEVFENLPEGTLAQLINNNIFMAPSPDFFHQDIITEISRRLSNYVVEKKLGKVIVAPMDVYFNSQNVFQPDIIFLSAERLPGIVQDGKIKGAPDLVIEVLSPGTEKMDKREKKAVYEQNGVKEYWMVAPSTKKVTGFQLMDGEYVEIPSQSGVITSCLLGVTINF